MCKALYCRLVIALLLGLLVGSASAVTVRINEVMASNGSTIADEDGDFEDWIELYNYGDEPVDLSGWGLSDNYDQPFKWTFPESAVIHPDEYLLVWASGKARESYVYETDWWTHYLDDALGIWRGYVNEEGHVLDLSAHQNHGQTGSAHSFIRVSEAQALGLTMAQQVDLSSPVILDQDFTVSYWFNTARPNEWRIINNSSSLLYTIGHASHKTTCHFPTRHGLIECRRKSISKTCCPLDWFTAISRQR